MTKKKKYLDACQSCLDFDTPIETYIQLREHILSETAHQVQSKNLGYEEYCIELAVAIKKTIRGSGMSKEHVVDAVNDYFGWPRNDGRKSLSIHMLNNYLCKPTEYTIPTPIIHAVQRICKSLEPIMAMAEIEDGRFITREELNTFTLGKIESLLTEVQNLKKTFRSKNRRKMEKQTILNAMEEHT